MIASLVALAAIAPALPVTEAWAQQPSAKALAEARTRYEKGKQLYGEGAFDAALAELQRSYELAPSYKILYNIALVQRARNDFAGALSAYEKYLSDGAKDIPASRKQEVQKELETLRTLVVRVEIRASVTEADIAIDDVPVGKSPLSGVVLNPGTHRISGSKEGRQSAVKVVKTAGGDSITVELDLPEAGTASPPSTGGTVSPPPTDSGTAPPPPTGSETGTDQVPPPPPPSRGPVWVGWVITGALAVGAGVTGGLAMNQAGAHSDLRSKDGVTQAELEASRSDAKTYALATDILIPCAVVAGAISLYLSVRPIGPAKTGLSSVRVGASPVVGPQGVNGAAGALSGSF
ncbi:MAG: PEGA domain-containing protein [Polyangiaceae bacterium]